MDAHTRDALEALEPFDEMVTVYYKDGSAGNCVASDAPAIERALELLVGEGVNRFEDDEARDSIVRMTAANGSRLVMLASAICGFSVGSRETRRRQKLIELALGEENADLDPERDSSGTADDAAATGESSSV